MMIVVYAGCLVYSIHNVIVAQLTDIRLCLCWLLTWLRSLQFPVILHSPSRSRSELRGLRSWRQHDHWESALHCAVWVSVTNESPAMGRSDQSEAGDQGLLIVCLHCGDKPSSELEHRLSTEFPEYTISVRYNKWAQTRPAAVTTRQSQTEVQTQSILQVSRIYLQGSQDFQNIHTSTKYMMTQLINNHPAPSVHAAPNCKTETTVKAKKFSKRVSWSSELTSVRLITPEVKGVRFRPFPIPEEDEEQEEEVINMRHVNHLLWSSQCVINSCLVQSKMLWIYLNTVINVVILNSNTF